MPRHQIKRETDLQIISQWIDAGCRVLDLGCGRGVLLEHLVRTKQVYGIGIDNDLSKIQSCIQRGVNAYQGDAVQFLDTVDDQFFDWIVISRTVQELNDPSRVILKALEKGKGLAIGFVNHGFWINRIAMLRTGSRVTNEVFPLSWEEGAPYNPVTIQGFESFCHKKDITIVHKTYLKGDWKRTNKFMPNLFAGYAIYHLSRA